MKILIDASYWQLDLTPANWEIINRGVDGLIIRLGYGSTRDSFASTHIANCKKFGKPYAGYWYVYTDTNLTNQASAIKAAVDELKPCAFWMDVEDVDSNMSKSSQASYYKALREKVGSMISIPKGCYSGEWYLSMFSGALNWVKFDTYWSAEYLAWYEAAWWKLFKAKWGIMDVEKLHEIAEYAGIHNGIMRQIESKIPVAGMPLNLDWNIISDDNFAKIFTNGSSVPYTPPEFQSYIVTPLIGVNVRKTPSTSGIKIGALPYKTIVSIQTVNMTAGWGQLVSSPYSQGWVFLSNLKAL
jgi:hypothetical protein